MRQWVVHQILYFLAASNLPNLQVDGKAADLWAAFRAWCAETFCSTEDMVGAQGFPSATCGCDVHLLLVSKVAQLRGSLVELGPIEGEKRIFKKQKSAVPPAEAWQKL